MYEWNLIAHFRCVPNASWFNWKLNHFYKHVFNADKLLIYFTIKKFYSWLFQILWCYTFHKFRDLTQNVSLQWRHSERDGVSNHRHLDGLPNRLFRRKAKKTSKLRVAGLCEGNSPVTGDFPAQRASDAEYVSVWWHHHALLLSKFADT